MTTKNTFIERILSSKEKGQIPIIAEIKAYSPSHGDLLKGRNIEDIAEAYVSAGATCISVVTGKWYHGTTDMLEKIAQKVELPILRKDFITSKGHITMSKKLGASAVLLTKKLILNRYFEELLNYCLEIDLVPFVEVSNEDELKEIGLEGNSIVAINNRDITVKERDKGSALKGMGLLPGLKKSGASLCVSASGITSSKEVHSLFTAGFDAFLIGTALMQADNIQKAFTDFSLGRTHK